MIPNKSLLQLNGHSAEKPKSPSPMPNSNQNGHPIEKTKSPNFMPYPDPSPSSSRPSPSGSSTPDEWKTVGSKATSSKAKSFADMAKKPGNPTSVAFKKRVPFPEKTIAQTNRPHCYFKIQVDNEVPFRVLIELRPDMAPKMCDNFMKLCKGLPDGRGYEGSRIYQAQANNHVAGGDFERDDGTGGHSAFDEQLFLAEQCPLKDCKGAIRMKGEHRTSDGRCHVGSKFMIWVGDLDYRVSSDKLWSLLIQITLPGIQIHPRVWEHCGGPREVTGSVQDQISADIPINMDNETNSENCGKWSPVNSTNG